MTNPHSSSSGPSDEIPAWLRSVQQQVESLRFGVVQITVHDSRVVQVEKTERVRFDTVVGRSPGGDRSPTHQSSGGQRH